MADDIGRLDGVAFRPVNPSRRGAANASLLPAQRLMLAILAHAVNDVQVDGRDGRRARRLSVDAHEWFASEDDAWPFSFLAICETLGLEASYLRSALRGFRRIDGRAAPHPRGATGHRGTGSEVPTAAARTMAPAVVTFQTSRS